MYANSDFLLCGAQHNRNYVKRTVMLSHSRFALVFALIWEFT